MMTEAGTMTGRHVALIALGALGIVVAVNILFVVLALKTHSGLDTGDAYTLGLAYNSHLEERDRQIALGWTITVDAVREDTGATMVRISMLDKNGQALSGFTLAGTIRRPIEASSDHALLFSETAPGIYETSVDLSHPGYWDLIVAAAGAADQRIDIEERLWLN